MINEGIWQQNVATPTGRVGCSIACLERTLLLNLTPGQVGILQVKQKITMKNNKHGGRTDSRQQNKARSVAFFWYSVCMYVYIWLSQIPFENPNIYQKYWLTLIIVFTAQRGHSISSRLFSACVSLPTVVSDSKSASKSLRMLTDLVLPWFLLPLLLILDPHAGSYGFMWAQLFVYFWCQDLPHVTHTKKSFWQSDAI